MGFDPVDAIHVLYTRALPGTSNGASHMGQHIGLALALGHLVVKAQSCRIVPPALEPRNLRQLLPHTLGIAFGIFPRSQENAHGAIGYLGSIGDPNSPPDRWIVVRPAERLLLVHVPGPRLSIRVQFGVVVVEPTNLSQIFIFQAIPLVVLVTQPAEELGKGKLNALGLLVIPRRGSQVVASLVRGHCLHLLDADNRLKPITPRLDLRRGRQQGDAPRRTGRLMPSRGQAAESRMDFGEKGAQMSLHAVELGRKVTHMGAFDFFGRNIAFLQCAEHALPHQRREMLVLLGPVASKIRLITAQHIYFRVGHYYSPGRISV